MEALPTVLIIDDDRQAREFYRDLLEAEGFAVVEASNGAEALLWLRRERAEIILLDLDMPVMGGRGFLEYRAQDIRIREIPVIMVCSQLDDPRLRQAILQLGADLLVEQPFRREELLGIIREILARPPAREVRHPMEAQEVRGRQDPRVALTVPVRIRTANSTETVGRLYDLSASGLGTCLPCQLALGETITVSLNINGRSLALTGLVRWGAEIPTLMGYRYGIRFLERQDDSFPLHAYSFFRGHPGDPLPTSL
ncbi:MAG: response regulator [Candidatus Methylomirabilales bacterium]